MVTLFLGKGDFAIRISTIVVSFVNLRRFSSKFIPC